MSREEQWIESARRCAEIIAKRTTTSSCMIIAIPSHNNDKTQQFRVKTNLSKMLPHLKFDFTFVTRCAYYTKYLVKWKLKDKELKQDKASHMTSIETLESVKSKLTPDEYNSIANDLTLLARIWYAISSEDENYFYIEKYRDDGSIAKFLQRRH